MTFLFKRAVRPFKGCFISKYNGRRSTEGRNNQKPYRKTPERAILRVRASEIFKMRPHGNRTKVANPARTKASV